VAHGLLNAAYMKRLVLVGMLLAGCGLFTGDDQHVCPLSTGAGQPAQGFRNPSTGICTYESPQPVDCNDPECPCERPGGGAIVNIVQPKVPAQPDAGPSMVGGECNGPCASLGEQACLANTACHASYLDSGTGTSFWSCWDIAPEAPQRLGCLGQDAFTCSIIPSCVSVYAEDSNDNTSFETCLDITLDCDAPGYHAIEECTGVTCPQGGGSACGCEELCVPDDPTCSVPCPPGDTCMEECAPDGTCQSTCVPSTLDPGQCSGPISCTTAPPACPVGTTAGIENGCWTGYCIPNVDCGPAACASLTDEASCTARPDCEAVYMGSNCTCDAGGCTCTTLTYERCESNGSGL
jgi:hypothetical protein